MQENGYQKPPLRGRRFDTKYVEKLIMIVETKGKEYVGSHFVKTGRKL